jgi:hypothetical protein
VPARVFLILSGLREFLSFCGVTLIGNFPPIPRISEADDLAGEDGVAIVGESTEAFRTEIWAADI